MIINITPQELTELLRSLQRDEPAWKAVDLPPAVRESIKGYFDREVNGNG